MASALCGETEVEADVLLDRLVLDQLVEPHGSTGRYRMHLLLWLFAKDLLAKDPDEATEAWESTFRWYAVKLFAHLEPGAQAAAEDQTRLDAEVPNLVALLEVSDHGGLDWYTAHSALGVAVFARSRALWPTWKRAIDLGLTASDRLGDDNRHASLLLELAHYQWLRESDRDAATASLAEALRRVDPVQASGLATSLHYRLAQVHREAGRDQDAERELAASVAAAATDDLVAGLIVNQFRAEGLARWTDVSEIDNLLAPGSPALPPVDEDALRRVVDLLAPASEAWAAPQMIPSEIPLRLLLAGAYVGTGRHEAALIELHRCRARCREHGERAYAPSAFLLLGKVSRELGLRRRARQAWAEGLALVGDGRPRPAGNGGKGAPGTGRRR